MSGDLAVRAGAVAGQELEAIKEQVRMIANTEFVPGHYRNKPHTILAAILYGREIGLEPMESLAEVYMVDGKPTLSAKAMLKRARMQGHSIAGQSDEKKAVVKGRRADNGDEMTVTYTSDMAQRAGLLAKQNWQNNPEDMLWARAVSRLCRRLFGDVFGALPYGPEELEVTAHDRVGQALDRLPPDPQVVVEEGLDGPLVDADFEDAPSQGAVSEPPASQEPVAAVVPGNEVSGDEAPTAAPLFQPPPSVPKRTSKSERRAWL